MTGTTHLTLALLATLAALGCGGVRPQSARSAQAAERVERVPTRDELVMIGDGFAGRGDHVRAAQYWVRALDEGAPSSEVLPKLLRAYIADQQYRLAVKCAEDQLRLETRAPGLRMLAGRLHEALGRPREAIGHYTRAVREAPHAPEAHFALASALHRVGYERARADQHYRRYLTLQPDGPYAERARAALLTEAQP